MTTSRQNQLTKFTVNLVPKAVASLQEAAQLGGISRSDVVNRALQAYVFLLREQEDGAQILLRDKTGDVNVVRFL